MAAEASKASKPRKERKQREQKPKDTVAAAHRAILKEDQEVSEVKRLIFVGKHMNYFEVFLSSAYVKRAQEALQEYNDRFATMANASDEIKSEIEGNKGVGMTSEGGSVDIIKESGVDSHTAMTTNSTTTMCAYI